MTPAHRCARHGVVLIGYLAASCTTFTTVRPAGVQPGLSVHTQATVAAPAGELPGWIWSFDCAEACNRAIPGWEVGAYHGVADTTAAYYLGAGLIAPLTPFVEGYRQFFGMPPVHGWAFASDCRSPVGVSTGFSRRE